ncbi:MAG: hypothetical protein ACIAQU_11930 [Phycisphaerales bacterium JB064]
MRTDALTPLTLCLLLAAGPSACAQQRDLAVAASDTAIAQPAQQSPTYNSAEQVLSALESADEDLTTFTSGIAYTTIKDLGGALTRRTGQIAYDTNESADGAQQRRFAVHFTTLLRGDRYLEDDRALQTIAFDGRWLWEKLHSERQINKREIVRLGETIDPFELGDGPFPPLPIGQQKDDILRRYQVQLVPWDQSLTPDPELDPSYPDEKREIDMAESLMEFAEGSVQLRLIPRADDGRFAEIRLWYKPDETGRLLPRMSRTVDASSNDISIVQLMHPLTINGPAREDLLTIKADDDPENPWNITETRLPPPPASRQPAGTTRTTPRDRP